MSLFAGGLGVPIPENALLIGGGYAIYQKICLPVTGMILWYGAIIFGDAILFLLMHWLFSRPSLSAFLKRLVKPDKLEKYKKAFSRHGGWTLFLARFTFGIRAVAYMAAGAAGYPLRKFLAVDSVSVGLQIFLFIGIGYYGSGRIEWAKAAIHEIAILLTVFALLSILVSVAASMLIKRFAEKSHDKSGMKT
ncbi:MAG: VTT domain-containing protein [Deltaproteobacteria bacterium]|nr:VTT domain-containing protein [Deltaproteobacteria bacterium]